MNLTLVNSDTTTAAVCFCLDTDVSIHVLYLKKTKPDRFYCSVAT